MKEITLSHGNRKLVSNDKVQFLIFNLPAVKTCPYSTPHCRKACYALKAERLYPSASASRERNYTASQSDSFVGDMITIIQKEYIKAKRNGKKILFRWHESGDIYSLEYAFKIFAIGKAFDNTDIIFQIYTKSIEYIPVIGISSNIHITYSIWDDTSKDDISRAKRLGLQTYTAHDKGEVLEKDTFECKCIDCAKCQACYHDIHKKISVAIH